MISDTIHEATELCARALDEQVSLSDFARNWPAALKGVRFTDECYADYIDLLEHWPSGVISRRTPPEWYRGDEYLRAYLDLLLLRRNAPLHKLERCRDSALRAGLVSADSVRARVDNFFDARDVDD